jgi:uncharacterized SAM-binding protein YcdF (DUF218 family)
MLIHPFNTTHSAESSGRGLKALRAAAGVLAAVLAVDALYLLLIGATYGPGIGLLGLAIGCLAAFALFYPSIRAAALRSRGVRAATVAVAALCLFFAALLLLIGIAGSRDSADGTEEVLIILGAQVHGEQVSIPLERRLTAALRCAEESPRLLLLASGGQGPGERISEAEAMKRWLVVRGIGKERILMEEQATSTEENFRFSAQLLERTFRHPVSVAFVTERYHIYRASRLAKAAGLSATAVGAPTELTHWPAAALRESLALIKLWVLGC